MPKLVTNHSSDDQRFALFWQLFGAPCPNLSTFTPSDCLSFMSLSRLHPPHFRHYPGCHPPHFRHLSGLLLPQVSGREPHSIFQNVIIAQNLMPEWK